jgi:hypothetical protein
MDIASDEPICALVSNDDGTVVWVSASTSDDRIVQIEDGVSTGIPAVVPIPGGYTRLNDIVLDANDQPIVAGAILDVNDVWTYFVMRRVDFAWQIEHAFAS